MEESEFGTITEMAAAEEIDRGYVGRIMRLILLAPDIVETILSGRQAGGMTLLACSQPFPMAWDDQRRVFGR